MKAFALLVLCLAMLISSACSTSSKPDLRRLYGSDQSIKDKAQYEPIIFIHGVFGARLSHKVSKKAIWPGDLTDILFSPYRELSLQIDPNTLQPINSNYEATSINDVVAGQDFYGNVLKTLTNAAGYQLTTPGTPIKDKQRRLYTLIYDWRQDNVKTAGKLNTLIQQIRNDHNQQNLKVNIVAHSMGGLIARYFYRYGTLDVLDNNNFAINNQGAEKINKMILIGTPNLGSVSSLHEFIQGFKVGLNRIPTEVLATMPSAFQLFPHPIRNYMVNLNGQPLDRDIFDVNIWRAFQWSIFDPLVAKRIKSKFKNKERARQYIKTLEQYFEKHLERARRFVWALTVKNPLHNSKLIVFGGDCELTPSRLLIEEVNGESILRLSPNDIDSPLPSINYHSLMLEPGDGRVTKPSLFARDTLDPTVPRHKYSFFPMAYSILLCESHDRLAGNIHFQNNLLNILLSRD